MDMIYALFAFWACAAIAQGMLVSAPQLFQARKGVHINGR